MLNNHPKTRLKANARQVGERCPVSGETFEIGDDVVICQESDVAFSAKHWSEAVSMWAGRCPYCDSDLSESPATFPPTKSKPFAGSPRRQVSIPIWVMILGGVTLMIVGILGGIAAFNLIVTEDDDNPSTATTQTQLTSTTIARTTATPQAEESAADEVSDEQAKVATAQVKTATAIAREVAQNEDAARDAARLATATAQARATATAKTRRTSTARAKATATAQARVENQTPTPQVFANMAAVNQKDVCNCRCSASGAKVYDFGGQINFCFKANFTTRAQAFLHDPDGNVHSLANWNNLGKANQCLTKPLPHDPNFLGLWQLKLVGYDGPNGQVTTTRNFCLDECRGC